MEKDFLLDRTTYKKIKTFDRKQKNKKEPVPHTHKETGYPFIVNAFNI